MKLPINLPFGKKEKSTFFLALLLRDEKVCAVIFEEFLGKIKVVGEAAEYFLGSIEKASLDELLETCDKTISQTENFLPQPLQTIKTVFGLKENWVEESKIKPEYLAKIKRISDELELSPIGFLTIHEAIAHLLQKEEGAPVSAILAEIDKRTVTISLLRGGKIIETRNADIEESSSKTIDKLLHHFTNYEVLPSRIIIFDGKNTESISQEFISHSWSKSLPFLHVPQTTPLPRGFDAKAVLFGAATQMGFEMSSLGQAKLARIQAEEPKIEEAENEAKKFKDTLSSEDFGFFTEKDVADIKDEPTNEVQENFQEEESPEIKAGPRTETESKQFVTSANSTESGKSFFGKLLSLKTFFGKINIWKKIPKFSLPSQGRKIIFIPPFVVLLIALIVIFYIFLIKATVVITVSPKIIEKSQAVIFSTNGESEFGKNIIAAQSVEVSEDGSISGTATGKKEVGDKAKGTVTVYNSTTKEQVITKGTSITSANNLQFMLDDSVKIASSGGASDGAKTAKASVTAKDIGKEFNLPSGTKFTLDDFSASEIEAKNDSAFSGGNKKEVTVVSKDDLNKLTEALLEKLEEKAKEDIAQKISADMGLLPAFVTKSLSKKSFDKKEGQEAASVTLEGTGVYQGISYKKSDINSYFKSLLKEDNPDLEFLEDRFKYDVQDLKEEEEKISATLTIKALLLPKIDDKKLAKELAGKSFEETQSLVLKIPQVSDVLINLSPPLPFFPKMLPKVSGNISLKIVSND